MGKSFLRNLFSWRSTLALALAISPSAVLATNYIDNIGLGGNTISTVDTNGDLTVAPNGTGKLIYSSGTATTIPYLDASKKLTSSAVTPTELGTLSGVTATLCGISQSCTLTNKTISGASNTITNVSLATGVTGTLPVGNGGTGLASGTSGGVAYFSGSTTIASSSALTANRLVLGGGAGVAPGVLASLGTTTTLLHGNASGAPTFGAVDLTADVSGTLPPGSGGTGGTSFTAHGVLIGAGSSALVVGTAGTSGQLWQSKGSSTDPNWTTPTYPAISGSTGKVLLSDGTNIIYSTPTFPNASATAGKHIVSDGTNWIASTPTFPNSSVTAGKFIRSDATNFAASTATIPDTATAGSILNASGSNVWATTVTPTIGVAGSSTGTLSLTGVTSGTVTVQPQSAAGTYNFNLPIAAGSTGNYLKSGGGGSTAMAWGTIDDLLPTMTGHSGEFLTNNGSASSWGAAGAVQNWLVNAEFRFFQQTTPATLTTVGDGSYCNDEWFMIDSNGSATSQCARVDASGTSVGGQYTQYWANFRQSNATAKQIGVCQPLETNRTISLRGKSVTFAYYAKTDGTEITTLRTCIGEWTGTADTITKDVVGTWGATPTWIASFACDNTPADQTISSTWAQLSTTATVGTSANNLIVCVWTPNTEAQNDDFYLSQTQLVVGSVAQPWSAIQKAWDHDLMEVRRFYQKSFAVDTAPVQNAGTTDAVYLRANYSTNLSWDWVLVPRMRSTPSVTAFNTSAGNALPRNTDAGSDGAFVDTNFNAWVLNWSFNAGSTAIYRWHWSADARL